MKTYSAHYQSGGFFFEKKPAAEMWSLIPVGSKLVGGDRTYKGNTISQAIYELTDGTKIIIREDKP